MISLLLFGGGTYVYESLSFGTLKVPTNVLTKITIGNTELSYLYTPDSGLLRTNIVFANVNDTFSVKVIEGYSHSWGGWVSNFKEVSPDYIVLFFEPINLKPVNENWW